MVLNTTKFRVNHEPTPEELALQDGGQSFMNQSQVSGFGAPSAPGAPPNPILAALSNAVKGAAAKQTGMSQTMPPSQGTFNYGQTPSGAAGAPYPTYAYPQ